MRIWLFKHVRPLPETRRVRSGGIGGDGEFSEGRRELSLRVGIDADFVWPRRF
jgi:hypothetical protein